MQSEETFSENSMYDIIIAGGGMAGLSMLRHLRMAGLDALRVLVLERESRKGNDRTWCFWENDDGPFESIVHRAWDQVRVHGGPSKPLDLPLLGYRYKMIRSLDLYHFMDDAIANDPLVERRQAEIQSIREAEGFAEVVSSAGTWRASVVFDSTHRLPLNAVGRHHLLQHFLGYVIRTEQPVFDTAWPDLMHFGIPQQDECRFVYVLPLEKDLALIEFTVFSERLLERNDYETALEGYIRERLGPVGWSIQETEYGVIPMSDEPAKEFPSPHVVRIGTSGGYTNPATGYTFRNTQKRLAELVRHYRQYGNWQAPTGMWQWRFGLYASVMLNVLEKRRVPAPEMFYDLYRKNPVDRVFRFLDGESTFTEEVKLMSTTAIRHFLLASADVIRRRLVHPVRSVA